MGTMGEFRFSSGEMEAHQAALTASGGKLRTNLEELQRGDKGLEALWEGEMRERFSELQRQFGTAFNEFNAAFTKFITTTGTNGERTTETERSNVSALS